MSVPEDPRDLHARIMRKYHLLPVFGRDVRLAANSRTVDEILLYGPPWIERHPQGSVSFLAFPILVDQSVDDGEILILSVRR